MEEEDKQYLSQVGMYLADLFYNQKNINMKEEMLEEAAEEFANDCTLVSDAAAYKGFINGAIWMKEEMEKLKDFDTWKEWKNTGIIKSE